MNKKDVQKPGETTRSEASSRQPIHVGTMGWGYADWSGPFYPPEASSRDYIALYSRTFDTVEIDSTFYATPRETQVKHWAKVTPEGFLFCPKVPRLITHDQRLVGVEEEMKRFVEVMALMGTKRGPMLLQFPPDFTRAELEALKAFLPLLQKVADPAARFAVEFRHRSWIGSDVSALLSEYKVALVAADYAPMPSRFELTGEFAYVRLIGRHGAFPQHRELQADRTPDLERWARVLQENASQYQFAVVFLNNDYEGFSPDSATKLKQMLGLPTAVQPREVQGALF